MSDHGAIPIANGYNPQRRMALIFRQKYPCRDEHSGPLFSCKDWQPRRLVGEEGSVVGRWERRLAATRKPFGSLVRSVQIILHLFPSSPALPSSKERHWSPYNFHFHLLPILIQILLSLFSVLMPFFLTFCYAAVVSHAPQNKPVPSLPGPSHKNKGRWEKQACC